MRFLIIKELVFIRSCCEFGVFMFAGGVGNVYAANAALSLCLWQAEYSRAFILKMML